METKPKIYTEEFVKGETQKILDLVLQNKEIVYLGEIFEELTYPRQNWSEWTQDFKENEEISDTIKRVDDILERRKSSGEQISSFQDFVLNNGFKLREAINSGERSFADLLKLFEKAASFKSWLKNQKPDENLCKNYLREATASTWIEKLPAKKLRWSLFTGAGLAIDSIGAGGLGTAMGVGLSAADAFLVDKIINGWKPNHFINEHLVNFFNK